MRGVPRHPVVCLKCGESKGAAKDRLCHRCRIKSRPNANKRFYWNADLDSRLRAVYAGAKSRKQLTENLNAFQYSTGFTRIVLISRATRLGLSFSKRRSWSPDEIEFMEENLGRLTIPAIARKLSRSYYSVKAQIARLELSGRVKEGYTKQDVIEVLGVGRKKVEEWIETGWLVYRSGRIPENSVTRFLKAHPEEYQLGRVDEAWFKGLIFPSFGQSIWNRARHERTNVGFVHATMKANAGGSAD